MTAAEKTAKLNEINQRMTDAAKGRDFSDIPWTDPYWNICNTARIDMSNLLATKTEEVPEIVPEVKTAGGGKK